MLKTGVVGVGSLGRHHARILESIPGVKLVGVADINEENGRKIAHEYSTKYFRDYRDLIPLVECASVAAPTVDHHAICSAFISAGKHVLVEKPISATLEEGQDLVRQARERKVTLQVGHLERFNPAYTAIRDLITEPKFFEAHRLGIFVPRSLDIDVVMDLMIHDIDMVLSLVKSGIRDIRAVGIPILTEKVDIANVRIEFENGVVANLTASRVSSEKVRKLRFFQPDDYVSMDLANQTVNVFSLQPADTAFGKEIITRNILVEKGEPLRFEILHFLDCVRSGKAPLCGGDEGLTALRVAQKTLAVMHTV
ncbi:MAG: Gfo/Idh/MocA family oxidoreductase [Acidobacteria bacterium]|nr:Gfo/Idh/MocA family oxidoreductase [Acidobacteriota bacterium]